MTSHGERARIGACEDRFGLTRALQHEAHASPLKERAPYRPQGAGAHPSVCPGVANALKASIEDHFLKPLGPRRTSHSSHGRCSPGGLGDQGLHLRGHLLDGPARGDVVRVAVRVHHILHLQTAAKGTRSYNVIKLLYHLKY